MSNFWQTMILAVLPVLVAGRVAVTRTGRLRKDIRENLDLLGKLPTDHPNRATLEAHNGELLGLLVRRQQRRYEPFTKAGVSLGALAGVAAVAFVFACGSALLATGVLPSSSPSDPQTPGDQWAAAVFFLIMTVAFAGARSSPPDGSSGSTRRRSSSRPRLARGLWSDIRSRLSEPLHAMPSAPRHVALRRHARHRISPAQGGCGTRRRGATRGCVWDRC